MNCEFAQRRTPQMPRMHIHMHRRAALLVGMFFASCAGVLRAQSTNGSIAGRVTDPSKAVIMDAKVAGINTGTNVRYEGATNGSGEYYLTNLLPASYRIEIEKAGFQKLIKQDVILHVQDALAINFEMTVGSASESITVEAGAPVVNTQSAAVSTVIDRALKNSGARNHTLLYPAEHAFTRDEGPRFDPEATNLAFAEMIRLFRKVFRPVTSTDSWSNLTNPSQLR